MKKIIADPNIPLIEKFAVFGEVIQVPGREWNAELVRDADILLTRSVTKVNAALLDQSSVTFVGSATSGFDHIDRDYLAQRGIHFVYCPGSNANSVAEYVLSALIAIIRPDQPLAGLSAGIIGCGHVGSRVATLLEAVGINCILNDPPLQDLTGDKRFQSLNEALTADIISLHTPLTLDGDYPSDRLINENQLLQMKPDVILINAARGRVINEAALLNRMEQCPSMKTVIDCWENEPSINPVLLQRVTLGTPHIAGYSFDGKVKATQMLFRALADFLRQEVQWEADPDSYTKMIDFATASNQMDCLRWAVLSSYDIRLDHEHLRRLLTMPSDQQGKAFDQLRKLYPIRHEFDKCETRIPARMQQSCATLQRLGFQITESGD